MAQEKKEDIQVRVRGRLSFADHLVDAERGEKRTKGKHAGKVPYRWSVNFLFPKTDEATYNAVREALKSALLAQWPTDTPKIKADKLCLRDGDEETYAGYAGHWFISASRTAYASAEGQDPRRPFQIIDRNRVLDPDTQKRVFPDASGKVYAGCYVNAILRIWAQDDVEFGKRLNASIEGIQFWEDGEAFGGGGAKIDVESAFEEYGGDDAFAGGDDSPAGGLDDLLG